MSADTNNAEDGPVRTPGLHVGRVPSRGVFSANATTAASKGRKKIAQGKDAAPAADADLGNESENTSSPEGAKECGNGLLSRILNERRKVWVGKGRYKEPLSADSKELPALPISWTWASLDQLLLNITDGDHQPPPQTASGVPFVVIGNVRSGKLDLSDTRFVSKEYAESVDPFRKPKEGDILYTLVGSFGSAIRVTTSESFCIQRHIAVLRPHSLSPTGYLAHILNSPAVFARASAVATGTAQKTVPLAGLRRFPLPLPPPVDQRRIVAEIDKQFTRLEAGVAALRRVQANLKRYRAAVLKAACEGKLVPTEAELQKSAAKGKKGFEPPVRLSKDMEFGEQLLQRILDERRREWNGKGKHKEPGAPDVANLPSLPNGWTWGTVEQLASPETNSITDGPFGSNLKTEHYTENGPRVIRLKNIGDGVFVNEYAHISEEHFGRLQKHRIFENDIVIAGLGENPPRSCIVPDSVGPAIVKADCIRFKAHHDLHSKFFNYALNSEPVRRRTKNIVHGVGRPRLNLGEIKAIVLPVPPLAEQKRIVAEVERRLSVVEELEALVSANLQRTTRLRQSILQKAFTGELVKGE